jgi:hypothetical protein
MVRRTLLLLLICAFALPAFAGGSEEGPGSDNDTAMEMTPNDSRLYEAGLRPVSLFFRHG